MLRKKLIAYLLTLFIILISIFLIFHPTYLLYVFGSILIILLLGGIYGTIYDHIDFYWRE